MMNAAITAHIDKFQRKTILQIESFVTILLHFKFYMLERVPSFLVVRLLQIRGWWQFEELNSFFAYRAFNSKADNVWQGRAGLCHLEGKKKKELIVRYSLKSGERVTAIFRRLASSCN